MAEHLKALNEQVANFKMSPRIRSHHYNYGNPGEQAEGIRRRIRQGLGGSKKIEPGVEVEGHYHIPKGYSVNSGDTIIVDDKSGTGGKWAIMISQIGGYPGASGNREMIVQNDKEVTGAEFFADCIQKAS